MAQFNVGMGGSSGQPRSPFSSLTSVLVAIGFMVLFFLILRGFINFLYWSAPVLLILALLVNRQVVFKYANQLVKNFNTNVLQGIIWIVFLIIGYPFVFLWLLIKALLYNHIKEASKQREQMFRRPEEPFGQRNAPKNDAEEWTDYEEIK